MLAYLDTLRSGLVPCRVIAMRDTPRGLSIDVQFTASRGPYAAGDVSTDWTARTVVPRSAVIRRRSMSGPRILPYDWRGLAGENAFVVEA